MIQLLQLIQQQKNDRNEFQFNIAFPTNNKCS